MFTVNNLDGHRGRGSHSKQPSYANGTFGRVVSFAVLAPPPRRYKLLNTWVVAATAADLPTFNQPVIHCLGRRSTHHVPPRASLVRLRRRQRDSTSRAPNSRGISHDNTQGLDSARIHCACAARAGRRGYVNDGMLYYNDDSGLSGIPLASQRVRMSTHTSLEDITRAERLELFQHRLPAQITSFPIGTETSSSTLCQLLTEELGVRLIDLNQPIHSGMR
eukprot:1632542-Prymnesium_polylepis.1